MDQIREIFYWTATIVLMLIGLVTIAAFSFLVYLKRVISEVRENIGEASRAWRNLTLTRFVIRALRLIF